jgi:tetratricopeptide (TPR) repeat protein
MANQFNGESSRQRGVKASLIKIRAAMVNAGLYSQSDIAKKIQELEQSSATPRSLVSRVCRGESVDPVSIERVAAALGVPGWQLYLDSAEHNLESKEFDNTTLLTDSMDGQVTTHPKNAIQFRWLATISGLSLLFIILVWAINAVNKESNELAISSLPDHADISLVIWPKDILSEATASGLAIKLNQKNIVAPIPETDLQNSQLSIDLAKKYESDSVVSLSAKKKGRYVLLQAQIYFNGVERVIGYYVFPHANQIMYATLISTKLQVTIDKFLSYPRQPLIYDASFMHAMDVLLEARVLLDNRDMPKDGDKIAAILLAELSERDDIADLHAALCQTYALKSWQEEEKKQLEKAAALCSKALSLDPNSLYAQAMHAELGIRNGQTEKVIGLYSQILETWPNHLLSLSGSAQAYIVSANLTPDTANSVLTLAERNLLRAIIIEEDFWYYYETLGTVYFNLEQADKSLSYFQQSANLSQNPLSLTNVGILTLCNGDFQTAENLFQDVIQAAPNSHLGYQFLGLLYSYQGKNVTAIHHIQIALDKLGKQEGANIHDYWGYLADTYRWSGKKELAISAYKQATKSLQHYTLRGVNGVSEDASQLYYEIQLSQLTHSFDQDRMQFSSKFESLKNQDAGMAFNLKISQMEIALSTKAKAIERWKNLSNQCQFYKFNPDFKDAL